MKKLFEAQGLTKRYGSRNVVSGIDLRVFEKEIIAVIGPNGSGKTTTIEMILGLRVPDSGKVNFWCQDYKNRLGAQLQSTPFFPGLTTKENLRLFASFYGLKPDDKDIEIILEKFSLSEVAKTLASKISGGQQKRLAIAITTLHGPELIFLDEPTAALDPRARHEIRQLIISLNNSGTAVVFTSHDMEEVSKIAHRVVMINNGKVMAEGTPDQLCQYFNVQNLNELYLRLTMKEE